MESFIHSGDLWDTHSGPGTVPGAENTSVDKIHKDDQRRSHTECIQGPVPFSSSSPALESNVGGGGAGTPPPPAYGPIWAK